MSRKKELSHPVGLQPGLNVGLCLIQEVIVCISGCEFNNGALTVCKATGACVLGEACEHFHLPRTLKVMGMKTRGSAGLCLGLPACSVLRE